MVPLQPIQKFSDLSVYLSQQGSAGNRKYYINLLLEHGYDLAINYFI
jgi:hypothetical protein